MPEEMSKYFCFNAVRACNVGLIGQEVDGHTLSAQDMVFPCAKALPMGFSWSLYFCQQANERIASLAPGVGQHEAVSDKGPPMVFHLGHGANGQSLTVRDPCSPLQHYIYVDSIGVLGLEHEAVEHTLADIVHEFEAH
eukprot:11408963-Heterocapsa_arctica.AAC.1